MRDFLSAAIRPMDEPWKPAVSEQLEMIETLIDKGSYYGLSINEVLDTKEARRAAALALAARELHAEPEIDNAAHGENGRDDKLNYLRQIGSKQKHHWIDKGAVPDAISQTASKMVRPSGGTRGMNREATLHSHGAKPAKPTTAFRKTTYKLSTTHVNPVETGKDYLDGGKSVKDHMDCKTAQKHRNIANAEKILGAKDKEGYGYSTNKAVPHIHAKIAAHKDADDKAWKEQAARGGKSKGEHDREWQDAIDAKAKRVHDKPQFAGNSGKDQQYYTLGTTADQVPTDYKDALYHDKLDKKHGAEDEADAHDERVKHYQALDRHLKNNPPKYKEVQLRNGQKGKVAVTGHELSSKLKYHRELDAYKTAKARYEPVGKKPEAPKSDKHRGIDVNLKRDIKRNTPNVKNLDNAFRESCGPGIDALLRDLRHVMQRPPQTEREVLGGAFPSKYAGGLHIMAALKTPETAG